MGQGNCNAINFAASVAKVACENTRFSSLLVHGGQLGRRN